MSGGESGIGAETVEEGGIELRFDRPDGQVAPVGAGITAVERGRSVQQIGAAVLHQGEPLTVERRGDDLILSLELPFADHDDLDLGRVEDELLVRVGPYRRGIVLPDSLKRRTVSAAKMVGDRLEVTFVTEEGIAVRE